MVHLRNAMWLHRCAAATALYHTAHAGPSCIPYNAIGVLSLVHKKGTAELARSAI